VDEARRNLTDSQRSYLRGKRYETEKKLEGAQAGNNNAEKQLGKSFLVESRGTAAKIADQTGVTERTIRNDAQFSRAVTCRGTCSARWSCPTVAIGNDRKRTSILHRE